MKRHLDLCQWHRWSSRQIIIECFYILLYQGLYTRVNLVSVDFLECLNVNWDFSQVCEWSLYPIQGDSWTMTQFKNLCFKVLFMVICLLKFRRVKDILHDNDHFYPIKKIFFLRHSVSTYCSWCIIRGMTLLWDIGLDRFSVFPS